MTQTKFNTYQYKRRVPTKLSEYFNTNTIRVSLGAEKTEATQQAIIFNTTLNEALQLQPLGISQDIIKAKLSVFSPAQHQLEIPKAPQEVKSKWKQVTEDYINSKIDSVSADEIRDREYFYYIVAPSLFKHIIKNSNPDIAKLTYQDLLECKNIIIKLPKRNIQKYRSMTISAIINSIDTISSENMISNQTANKYIKERLSELYKCKIVTEDGVKCFSLLDPKIKLKTNTSYRLIPIHSSLLDDIDNYSNYLKSVKSATLARNTTDIIKANNFKDKQKKSLYSLRHSIATQLIHREADSNIVSELLGHSHTSMTLSRYSKGYTVTQLKAVIELLEAV